MDFGKKHLFLSEMKLYFYGDKKRFCILSWPSRYQPVTDGDSINPMFKRYVIGCSLLRHFGNNRAVRVAAPDGIIAVVNRDVTGPFSKRGRQTKIVPAPHYASPAPRTVTDRFRQHARYTTLVGFARSIHDERLVLKCPVQTFSYNLHIKITREL